MLTLEHLQDPVLTPEHLQHRNSYNTLTVTTPEQFEHTVVPYEHSQHPVVRTAHLHHPVVSLEH